jgi:Ca2+-binding RTX toxin-like protein
VGTGATSLLDQAKEGIMRRVTLMVAAVALMVSLFAVVAYAAEIQGTDKRDVLNESTGDDTIHGGDRGDTINANLYGLDRDEVWENKGHDALNVADGDDADTAKGGDGWDVCAGDAGDELDCEEETQ